MDITYMNDNARQMHTPKIVSDFQRKKLSCLIYSYTVPHLRAHKLSSHPRLAMMVVSKYSNCCVGMKVWHILHKTKTQYATFLPESYSDHWTTASREHVIIVLLSDY